MANEKKSIIEEALLEAEQIDAAFKSNAKEILSQTMSSEIEAMVKESLTGSKKRRLKEDDEEEEVTIDTEEGDEDEEMDLDLGTEEGDEDEEMDLDLDIEDDEDMDMDLDLDTEEGDEDMDMDMDFDLGGDESEEGEMDLDLGAEEGDEDMDMDLSGDEDMDVVDLSGPEVTDAQRISVFKKMGPDDEIEVVNDNGLVTLKDNKSGSEYRIELNSTGNVSNVEAEEISLGENFENYNGVIYEVVIDEDYMGGHEDHMGSSYAEDSYMDMKPSYMKSYASKEEGEEEEESHMGMKSYMRDKKDHMGMKSYMKGKKPETEKEKEFAALAEPKDEITYADKIAGAKKDYMRGKSSSFTRNHVGRRDNDYAINRMGGSESFKSTYGESKTPQITKLIKENTDLNTKNSTLEIENTELKENQEKMVDALKQFRKKLQEVAVFNSNLTYAVRLFTEQATTKEEKQDILKRLDSAKDLKESQSIYKQLVKEYSNGKAPIKESIEEKINKTATSGAQISESSVFVHPELQNMKKLWEYSYKK